MKASMFLLVLALSLVGCRDLVVDEIDVETSVAGPQVDVEPGHRFEIAIGEQAVVAQTGIRVLFGDVLRDERCSNPSSCASPGAARIRLELHDSGKFSVVDMNLPGLVSMPYSEAPRHWQGRVSLQLLGLTPYPVEGEEIRFEDYRAILVVDR